MKECIKSYKDIICMYVRVFTSKPIFRRFYKQGIVLIQYCFATSAV